MSPTGDTSLREATSRSASLARQPQKRAAGAASARNGEVADAGPHRSSAAEAVPSQYGHGRPIDERSRKATESDPPSSRAEATTLVRPSDAEFGYAATLAVADQPLFGGADAPADWCLDLGVRLITLSTFDTWSAIARGEVRGLTLAWREGLECWTPVEELPELACALSAEPTPEPVATDIEAPDSLAAFEMEEIGREDAAPLSSSARVRKSAPRSVGRVGRPAFFGAVFAAAAVLIAAFRPTPVTSNAAASASRVVEAQRAGLEMRASRLTVRALEGAVEATRRAEPEPPHATAARRADKGQRRLRRSGR